MTCYERYRRANGPKDHGLCKASRAKSIDTTRIGHTTSVNSSETWCARTLDRDDVNIQHDKELMPTALTSLTTSSGSAVRGIQATQDGMDRLCVRQTSKMGVGLLSRRNTSWNLYPHQGMWTVVASQMEGVETVNSTETV